MKNLIIYTALSTILLSACKEKKSKFYLVTMFAKEYNKSGNPFFLNKERITIEAENDTAAFNEALKLYYLNKYQESMLGGKKFNETVKFEVRDGRRILFSDHGY